MGSGASPKLFTSEGRCFPLFLLLSIYSWSSFLGVQCQAQQPLPKHEVETLKKIGSALGKQWNFSEDPCSGASDWSDSSPYTAETNPENKVICQCSPAPCHVIKIILKNQNLNGFLPAEFANLTSLQVIDLTRNYLNGTIPAAWASLPLTKLALTGNRITGQIPKELGNVITLQELILEDNQIDGSIPPSLGNLKVLSTLRLSGNYISGELPKFLGYLMNMTQFEIDGNPISGSIPSVFGNWTKLNQLSIQGTSLEGPVPVLPQSLIVLRVTDLRGGNGTFPPLMGLKGLKTLNDNFALAACCLLQSSAELVAI